MKYSNQFFPSLTFVVALAHGPTPKAAFAQVTDITRCNAQFKEMDPPCLTATVASILAELAGEKNTTFREISMGSCDFSRPEWQSLTNCLQNRSFKDQILKDLKSLSGRSSGTTFSVPIQVPLKEMQEKYPPNSCEGLYYGLFTQKDIRAPTDREFGIARADTLPRVDSRMRFRTSSSLMINYISKSPLYQKYPDSKAEWIKRIQATHFYPALDKPGPFMAEPSFKSKDKSPPVAGTVDFRGNPIFSYSPDLFMQPEIHGGRIVGAQAESTDLFLLFHEHTHSMPWAPEALQQCLSNAKSLGARRSPSMTSDSARTYLNSILNNPGFGATTGRGTIMYLPTYEAMLANPEVTEIVIQLGTGKIRVEDLTADQRAMLQTQLKTIISGPSSASALWDKNGNLRSGRDLQMVVPGVLNSQKLRFQLLGQYPEQISEAVADYNATQAVTNYLNGKPMSAVERKKAALDVLRALPPFLYTPKAEGLLNQVGSKMSNEQRAFKIILANPEFRQLLGCKFAGETPEYCDGANPIPQGAHSTSTQEAMPNESGIAR